MMSSQRTLSLGAASAAVAIALGAFGAHALRTSLAPEQLSIFETGVRYQMYHAFGLMILGLLMRMGAVGRPRLLAGTAWAFLAGSTFFSGSLMPSASPASTCSAC